jgi:hypothetical protein
MTHDDTTDHEPPRLQCAKCPWKKSTNPREIPNGYCETKHAALKNTIARHNGLGAGRLRIMACHESPIGDEDPCVGWLMNQLGPGNNIPLRLLAMTGGVDTNVDTVGPQHETFEATLPKPRRARRSEKRQAAK